MKTKEVLAYKNRKVKLFTGERVEVSGSPVPKPGSGWRKGTIINLYADGAMIRWENPSRSGRQMIRCSYTHLIPMGRGRGMKAREGRARRKWLAAGVQGNIVHPEHIATPKNALSAQKGVVYFPPSLPV